MPLPVSQRSVFQRNTLFSVSAQVRFTPILRIQVETPATFQEAIRTEFPGYTIVNPLPVGMPPDLPAEIQFAVRGAIQGGTNVGFERVHRFSSADGNWVLQLTSEAITMSCRTYPRWEIYREKLRSTFNSFVSVYNPGAVTMVGLRYQNAIERSGLGLSGVRWSELLAPFVAAELACPGIVEGEIVANFHRFEIRHQTDRIFIQHGLATNQTTKEPVYSIDGNYNSLNKVDLGDVFTRLDGLNKHSGSVFRLCITDRLYNSLQPIDF